MNFTNKLLLVTGGIAIILMEFSHRIIAEDTNLTKRNLNSSSKRDNKDFIF
ncbi:hypothetical protein CBO05C_0365 [Clostridium botulinum B str. Osaka05]|uniref:Uncharacterized protein n=1 Tax=Clostridium botulinum B str. Osaka05 TaxID=1407017 RepID=A0A0S6TXB7_CLOBO|nr:hypothetical protein CBO05C_0365 [Clostridium botulinum B str. Osaka05]